MIYLEDILNSSSKIFKYIENATYEKFPKDHRFQQK